jgi:NNP family nitrate/nitrite transporter-like MFS transporter
MELIKDSGWIGKIAAGTPDLRAERRLRLDAGADSAGLPRLVRHEQSAARVTPGLGGSISAMIKVCGSTAWPSSPLGVGLYLYLPAGTGLGLLNMWMALPLIMVGTLFG